MFSDDVCVPVGGGNPVVLRKSAAKARRVERCSRANHSVGRKSGPPPCRICQNIDWIRCNQRDAARILQTNVIDGAVQYGSGVVQPFLSRLLTRVADSGSDDGYVRRAAVRKITDK